MDTGQPPWGDTHVVEDKYSFESWRGEGVLDLALPLMCIWVAVETDIGLCPFPQ